MKRVIFIIVSMILIMLAILPAIIIFILTTAKRVSDNMHSVMDDFADWSDDKVGKEDNQ